MPARSNANSAGSPAKFEAAIGWQVAFVQDTIHVKNVLGGLHYQTQRPQGKLVRVVQGEVFDVAVNLANPRPASGKWIGETLSAENKRQIWAPEGFAHGFVVRSETAEFLYKTTDYDAPEHERCIAWNDPDLAISWPISGPPSLSVKDAKGSSLTGAGVFP